MDAAAAPVGLNCAPGYLSLAALAPGMRASVVSVGSSASSLTALERRLLEFGFVHGEQIEILAEARPGRDPFVVRVGHTTLALRRREVQSVWVELHAQAHVSADRVELHYSGSGASPHAQVDASADRVELLQTQVATGSVP